MESSDQSSPSIPIKKAFEYRKACELGDVTYSFSSACSVCLILSFSAPVYRARLVFTSEIIFSARGLMPSARTIRESVNFSNVLAR